MDWDDDEVVRYPLDRWTDERRAAWAAIDSRQQPVQDAPRPALRVVTAEDPPAAEPQGRQRPEDDPNAGRRGYLKWMRAQLITRRGK